MMECHYPQLVCWGIQPQSFMGAELDLMGYGLILKGSLY